MVQFGWGAILRNSKIPLELIDFYGNPEPVSLQLLYTYPYAIHTYFCQQLDRSATNDNQGCFAACESMIKKDGRQYCERENISSEKKK